MSPLLLGGAAATPIAILLDSMRGDGSGTPSNDMAALAQVIAGGGSIAPPQYGNDMMNLTPEELLMRALQPAPALQSTQATARAAEPASNYSRSPMATGTAETRTELSSEDRMFIDAAYAGIETDIQNLLQDPTKRAALGLPDDGMRDIPRTGQADTRGGVNRVNQYTSEHGVTASRDPKTGQVMLTNLGADGKPTAQSQKQVYGFNPMNTTGSVALDTIYEQIKNAKNADEARGIAAAARTSLAEEGAKIETQALQFAANKVGIPAMRMRLQQSEALDRGQPGYMPGIGDSKNTAALRNEVAQAEAQARQIAEDWKKSNISAARLSSTASNIEAELKRIDLLERKREGLEATTQAQAERRKEVKDQLDMERYDSFSPEQKMIMTRLNPELAGKADNQGEMVGYFQRQMSSDPAFKELIQADPADIVKLAARGNKLARALTVQEEAVATGRPPDIIDQEIRTMQNLANDPAAVNAWAMSATAGVVGDKVAARKEAIGRYNALASGTTKEEKAAYSDLRSEIALTAFKANKTAKFAADVTTWNFSNPAIQTATQAAMAASGKTDIDSVLTAYVGSSTGPESLTKYAEFKEAVRQAAQQQAKSVFGGVDSAALLSRIDSAAKEKGQLAEWYKQRWGWTEDISRSVVTNIADLLGN